MPATLEEISILHQMGNVWSTHEFPIARGNVAISTLKVI